MPDDSVTGTRADYVRILERADRGVCDILAALNQRGLTNSTLVILTNAHSGRSGRKSRVISARTPLPQRRHR